MTKKLRYKHIPNVLTIFRMVLVPFIIIFLFVPFGNQNVYQLNLEIWGKSNNFTLNFILAGSLFIVAAITDFVDGLIARKYKWESNFGKLWDPIADKVLINGVLISFAIIGMKWENGLIINYGLVPFWIPLIFITRDIIVDASRMYAANKNIVVSANFYGKIKTIIQMIAIVLVFFIFNYPSSERIGYWFLQNCLMYISIILSIISGIIYMKEIFKKNSTIIKEEISSQSENKQK